MGKIKVFLYVTVVFLMAFILALPSRALAQGVVVYCDNNYAPYSYVENGKVTGIYADIFKEAFSRMTGYSVTIKPVPWKRGVKLVEEGKGFALYPPYYRPKIRPFMDYPVPVLDEGYSMMTTKKFADGGATQWPEAYSGKKIGTNAGFAVPDAGRAKELGVKIEEASTIRSNLLKLISGRMDGYICDKNAMLWELKWLKSKGEYDEAKDPALVIATDISKEQGYMGFTNTDKGKFPFKDDFVKQFVVVIKEMKAKGEIQVILDSYIK